MGYIFPPIFCKNCSQGLELVGLVKVFVTDGQRINDHLSAEAEAGGQRIVTLEESKFTNAKLCREESAHLERIMD